ncbi:MAG: VTT domain-containing protein [Alphaproteobacteria bacterium]
MATGADQPAGTSSPIKRFLPLVILVLGLIAFFASGLHKELTLDRLASEYETLTTFVADTFVLAAGGYMLAYALTTAFSLPLGTVMTVAGGVLFGAITGTILTVLGATTGAVAVFIAAKTALANVMRAKAGKLANQLIEGFKKDAFNYMLFLRLVPLFPFWLVNIVPALAGVRLSTYAIATLIGIIPGTFVYVSVGNGFGAVLEQGGEISLEAFKQFEVWGPLAGLACLSLVPLIYKKVKGGKADASIAETQSSPTETQE